MKEICSAQQWTGVSCLKKEKGKSEIPTSFLVKFSLTKQRLSYLVPKQRQATHIILLHHRDAASR